MLMPLFRKFISLLFICLIFSIGNQLSAGNCPNSPVIRCISVDPRTGEVTISWTNPSSMANFSKFYIYSSTSINGPYTLIDSISNNAITSYTQSGSNASGSPLFYYVQSGCSGGSNLVAADTVSSINLVVNNPNNGTAVLKWNSSRKPLLTSSMGWYRVYKEYPAGVWTLVDSTQNLSLIDTISVCTAHINYKVEIGDSSGCVSVSSIDGNVFSDKTAPAIPSIDSVSVTAAGNAVVGFTADKSADTKGYVIYKYNGGAYIAIDTLWGINNTFYTNPVPGASTAVESYRVAAIDSCKNLSLFSNTHNSILVKCSPNPCARYNALAWNVYNNMNSGLKEYDVYISTNGAPFAYQATVPANSPTYVHNNMQQGFTYCYLIQAKDNSGTRTSTSAKLCYTANVPPEPTFSYLKSVSVPSNNTVTVNCYVDILAEIKKYKVMRSDGPSGPFIEIGSIPFVPGNPFVSFTDTSALTSEKSYYYKTIAVDTCNNDTTQTNVSRTILLKAVANDDLTNTITWNDYESWLGNVSSYNVYRAVDGVWGGSFIVNILHSSIIPATNSFSYTDDISPFYKGQGTFSYYVEALEGPGNPYGIEDSSRSNIADARQAANVFIPNAFAPNGVNKIFIPVTSYMEKTDYDFRIFDRWGEQVFQTSDPYKGWDGSIGSKRADEAVYVYLLQFKTAYGEYVERKGSVTLLR